MSRARDILLKWDKDGRYAHMFELDTMYPSVELFGEQCISAEVRVGWKDLLASCLGVLAAYGCKVTQVKQKFGGLRIYWQYPDYIESALNEWRQIPTETRVSWPQNSPPIFLVPPPFEAEMENIDSIVKPFLADAELRSYKICELCAGDIPDGLPRGITLCETCRKR